MRRMSNLVRTLLGSMCPNSLDAPSASPQFAISFSFGGVNDVSVDGSRRNTSSLVMALVCF